MNRDLARQALRVFEQCVDLPVAEIPSFLDQECADNGPLRERVEALLASQADAADLLPSTDAENQSLTLASDGAAPGATGQRVMVGSTLADRYSIIERIGLGGMGEVYRAFDGRLDREVAIKTLRLSGWESPELHSRFERELKAVASLSHTNIVTLYDVGDYGEFTFAVMELVNGKTLRTLIEEQMEWRAAVSIGREVACGLAAAHERGTMHRDIKPENVIVTPSGTAKILDFGLARSELASIDQRLTVSNMVPGTVPYMSPEQAEGSELTCVTDVFSLGIMLYEMLSGVNPFRGDRLFETMRRVIEATPPPLDAINDKLPAALVDLVHAMLARIPGERPSASEVAQRLEAIENDKPHSNSPSTASAPPTPLPATRDPKWQPSLIVLPFQVFGSGSELEPIADGLVENLTTVLTRVPLLSLTSRMSSFALKGASVAAAEVRQRFGVDYMIEGSLQSVADTIRANVQLIETERGFHVWAQQFECPANSNDAVTALLHEILARLEPQLVRAIFNELRNETGELTSRQLLIQAMGLLTIKGWHRDSFTEVADMLRKAIALESDLALAHAYLALIRGLGKRVGLVEDPVIAAREAVHHAEIALDLDDMDTNVLGLAGCAISDVGHADRAIPILKNAININRHNGQAHAALGGAYLMKGQPEPAVAALTTGIEVSPLDGRLAVWQALLGVAYLLLGNLDQALEAAQVGCQSDRKTYIPRVVVVAAHLARNEPDQAVVALAECLRVKPDLSHDEVNLLVGRELGLAIRKLRKKCKAE